MGTEQHSATEKIARELKLPKLYSKYWARRVFPASQRLRPAAQWKQKSFNMRICG